MFGVKKMEMCDLRCRCLINTKSNDLVGSHVTPAKLPHLLGRARAGKQRSAVHKISISRWVQGLGWRTAVGLGWVKPEGNGQEDLAGEKDWQGVALVYSDT